MLTASLSGCGLTGRMFLFQDLQLNGCDGLARFSGMVLQPLPHHCCQPTRSFFPYDLEGPEVCVIGSQSVAVKLLFSFFGDLLSTPPFSFCVADQKATQASGSQLYHLLAAQRIFFPK